MAFSAPSAASSALSAGAYGEFHPEQELENF